MDPECVVTEEEDGYNAESDLEEDTEQDCDRGETATFIPAVYTVDAAHRGLARVDEVMILTMMICLRVFFTLTEPLIKTYILSFLIDLCHFRCDCRLLSY